MAEEYEEYLGEIIDRLQGDGVRAELDDSDERMQKKIRNAHQAEGAVPADRRGEDRAAGTVSFRFRDGTQENGIPIDEAIAPHPRGDRHPRAGLTCRGSADYDGTEYPDASSRCAAFAAVPDAFQRCGRRTASRTSAGRATPGDECCPFCTAPTLSDEEALIVHRGEHAYVLLNLFPYNSGHLLVVPVPPCRDVRRGDARGGRRDRRLTQTRCGC